MLQTLIDTDILSEILKQRNAVVTQKAVNYLAQFSRFSISAMTRYEVMRGLLDKGASRQVIQFESFCQHNVILPVEDAVLVKAAEIWAFGRRAGDVGNDADLIIAATALHHGLSLTTGNMAHFRWIPSLQLENWRMA